MKVREAVQTDVHLEASVARNSDPRRDIIRPSGKDELCRDCAMTLRLLRKRNRSPRCQTLHRLSQLNRKMVSGIAFSFYSFVSFRLFVLYYSNVADLFSAHSQNFYLKVQGNRLKVVLRLVAGIT